jgi:hypothetical protein
MTSQSNSQLPKRLPTELQNLETTNRQTGSFVLSFGDCAWLLLQVARGSWIVRQCGVGAGYDGQILATKKDSSKAESLADANS